MSEESKQVQDSANHNNFQNNESHNDISANEINQMNVEQGKCTTCSGTKERQFIYALGNVNHLWKSLSIEKEYDQVEKLENERVKLAVDKKYDILSMSDMRKGDEEVEHRRYRKYRYLARQSTWVFSIGDVGVFVIEPKDDLEIDQLIESLKPLEGDQGSQILYQVLIGEVESISDPKEYSGLTLPLVRFDNLYKFTRGQLVDSLKPPAGMPVEKFKTYCNTFLNGISVLSENSGMQDEHRVINYLIVRVSDLYKIIAQEQADGYTFKGLDMKQVYHITRKMYDVFLIFSGKEIQIEKRYVIRIDITEQYPFVSIPLKQFF